MGRGGAREGSGRKLGSATRKTREIANKAAESGITPLEVMLDNMRFAHEAAEQLMREGASEVSSEAKIKTAVELRAISQNAAKDAAPYIHARLSSVEFSGETMVNHVIKPEPMTDEEMAAKHGVELPPPRPH